MNRRNTQGLAYCPGPHRASFDCCFFVAGMLALVSGTTHGQEIGNLAPSESWPSSASTGFPVDLRQLASNEPNELSEPTVTMTSLAPGVEPASSMEVELERMRARLDAVEKANQKLVESLSKENTASKEKKPDDKKPDDKKADSKKSDDKKADAKKDDKKKEEKKEDAWTDMSTDKWTVKMGGHIQMDYVNWATASQSITPANDYFEFRRLRLTADGTGYGIFDFRLQMTLEPETVGDSPPGTVTSPEVKDAYFSVNEIPLLGRWRIGNFFVPFSLEQVTNDTNNTFMERSIPTQGVFAADREVGMALYNCTEDKNATWTTGIFLDSISEALKERIDDNQGCRASGRLTWLPYYDEPSNGRYLVHTGLGVLYTKDQDKRVRFRARPQVHESPRLIDSGNLSADSYTTGNIEAAIVLGRFAVQSEAFLSSVNLLNSNPTNVQGAYTHMSYFLTGENRNYERFGQHGAQFTRNTPYTNFFLVPGGYGLGAWEAKARWSYLDLTKVNSGQYNDLTAGFNWYWSDRTRIMFDWIHPITSSATVFGATQSNLLAMRFDVNW